MKTFLSFTLGLCMTCSASMLAGCQSPDHVQHMTPEKTTAATSPARTPENRWPNDAVLEATYTSSPVTIDGQLDDPVWQHAKVYDMHRAVNKSLPHYPSNDDGSIQLAWDDSYFYLAAKLRDADVVDNAEHDQQFLHRVADTIELFLKPQGQNGYWEFHGTPKAHKATIFYPSRGRLGLYPWPYEPDVAHKVASSVQGKINDYDDRDEGFIVEMAVPIKALGRNQSVTFISSDAKRAVQWSILVARYNHSAFAQSFQAELSTMPKLIKANFHIYENWARLKLVK